MCLKPILIPNPNFNNPLKDTDYGIIHNCVDSHLSVPCGNCSVCIALRQAYLVQRMQMESLDNLLFFGMVSYNNPSLPSLMVNGRRITYAAGDDMSNMMRHVRLNDELPPFRYFAVSERGTVGHRPHWHFIISLPKKYYVDQYGRVQLHTCYTLQDKLWHLFLKYWRRNYGSRKFPDWRPLLTYKQRGLKRNYDLSFIDTISGNVEDAAFYCTKYATKYDEYTDRLKSALYFNLPENKFKDIWKIVRPKTLWSKGFGDPFNPDVKSHILKGIDFSIQTGSILPLFINPFSGQTFPLSPYYQKKFLDKDSLIHFKLLQSQHEKELPSIYETHLKDLMLERTRDMIRYRSDDGSQFLYDDYDQSHLIINEYESYGNLEKTLIMDDFTPDEW